MSDGGSGSEGRRPRDGKPMGGVTVSAKPDGGTITTSVFTDHSGQYYFPPLPAGTYRLWAQALSYQTAKG